MRLIAAIVTLFCCLLMFFVRRETKAALLLMGAMTLTLVKIPGVPLRNANFLIQAAFLLSELGSLSRHLSSLRHSHFPWKVLLLVTFSAVLAASTSPYVKLGRFLQSELLFKYFAIAYAFWAVRDERSLRPLLRVSLYCLLVLTFFGVLNYIGRHAQFVNIMTDGAASLVNKNVSYGDFYTERERFRVQSMFKWPFDYGYICAAMLILHLYGRHRRLETKRSFNTALVCCLFGIVMCGCRVVLAGTVISLACYSLWAFRLSRGVTYGMIFAILMILSYSTIPEVQDRVNMMADIFIEEGETGGSSIQMRMTQYAEVVYRIQGEEWLGLGKGYWIFIYSDDQMAVEGLLGVESVILSYLLERGRIGLILWAIFYIVIFRYFWKNRKKNKALTGLGAAVLTLYLTFSIGTGELLSVYPTMLLLGFAIKGIQASPLTPPLKGRGYRDNRDSGDSDYSGYRVGTTLSPSSTPHFSSQLAPQGLSALLAPQGCRPQSTKRLAIIIPAYKATFLPAALDSIAAQTCKDFTLYIGDDCSPEPIGNIVERYRDKIDLVYKRFDTNWGGSDLVAQWERCIDMSRDEPYIWLFSDDDVMEPNCVEHLLKVIDATKSSYDLYHFDVNEINEKGEVTKALPEYPQVLGAYDFYKGKNSGRYRGYVVENVFTRRVYEQAGGFKNFDLAWGSDVATWCIFCGNNGMYKVPGAHVRWRRSSQNITPNHTKKIAERKIIATCHFLSWAVSYFCNEKDILRHNRRRFVKHVSKLKGNISSVCFRNALNIFWETHGIKMEKPIIVLQIYLSYYRQRFLSMARLLLSILRRIL